MLKLVQLVKLSVDDVKVVNTEMIDITDIAGKFLVKTITILM